jgi:hypothetical protein
MNTQPLTPQSAGITGPMNINAVITHLIEMTPGQRKQFAQMHMDDPMMLSAAKFVDNQVNKQAQSLAAQQTGAAPPPVNQQAVAQMTGSPMPEDTGIAQLPAENMPSEYAGGGIVAFAEGGTPVVNALGLEIDPNTGYPVVPPYKQALQAFSDWRERTDNPARTGDSGPRPRNAQRTAPAAPAAARKDDKVKRDPDNYKPAETVPKKKVGIDQLREDRVEGAPSAPVARQPVQRAATPPVFQEAPYVPQEKTDFGAMLQSAKDKQGPVVDPYAAKRAEIGENRQAIARAEVEGAEERGKGIDALLSKKEGRVAEREERLKGQEETNLNMSLINAGLAMMQSTGKGLAGIAEGAQKGVGQYTEGLRLSEAARQKIEEARDAHDDLRFNLNNMSSKEKQAAKRSIEEAKILTALEGIAGLEKAFDISHKDAIAVYGAEMNERTAELNRAYQANEARTGRAFSASQDALKMAQAERLNALSISSAAGNAAASRELQRELSKMPSKDIELYKSLSPTGNVREGYEFAMSTRYAGGIDKAELATAKEIVSNAITPAQKSSPEYIAAQRLILNSLNRSAPPSTVSSPAGPVYAP